MQRNLFKQIGNDAETLATQFLEEAGFRIVERNYYARKLGEIDIIAQKEGVLHFIEVKSSGRDFNPVWNLTPKKMDRVIRSSHYYLTVNRLDVPYCIDAVLVRRGEVELLENITM